ncbi:metal ABC transporter substrate-binding protein [Treponema parvum]|uniref:Metal ABC transporter substrate-binding protein n=1 Tax=Treponema parvum TaxID=138851 RepID=A0A975ICI9_9SPIR|nr:metal ABC transporter substrate-binding protein [Treponema parvum]QTQ11144.1 metal ABC transporter substrate-binding protein [Treponema parvum]
MKKYIRFVGTALVLAAVAGCSKKSADAANAQVSARPKRVVTTFTILQDIAQNIGGDKILVESITKPGAEIHEYEPTPLDIVKAQSADLVLRNGFGLERWFEKFMGSVKNVPSVNLSDGIEPLGIGEGPYDGMPNPHSWMSPKNALIYVENIRKAFTDLDPANAKTYDANAASYSESIKKVDVFMAEKLLEIPAEQRWLVTCEGAFSYLIRDYDMKELYLWPVNADEEGSPRQIQKVVDTIRKNKIPVAFSESTISNKPQLQVCKETGAYYGGVLYVDSLTYEDGDAPTYLKMLEYNANTIVKGFEGNL